MKLEEAIKNPNKVYILKQGEILQQIKESYESITEDISVCHNDVCDMINDAWDTCFHNEPMNIATWFIILGTLLNGEEIKNIWSYGDFLEVS